MGNWKFDTTGFKLTVKILHYCAFLEIYKNLVQFWIWNALGIRTLDLTEFQNFKWIQCFHTIFVFLRVIVCKFWSKVSLCPADVVIDSTSDYSVTGNVSAAAVNLVAWCSPSVYFICGPLTGLWGQWFFLFHCALANYYIVH